MPTPIVNSSTSSDDRPPPAQRRMILFVMALSVMMVMSAVSGLNVALPDLARDTGASQSDLQWIVDAYALIFAGLLLPAGALGDRYGRKGVLLAGLAIFGAAALASATLIDSPAGLIGLRAAMGVGAALVMPTTLSVITTSFPEEERGRAVGLWVGVAGGGAVLGLLGSGLLLEWFSWSSFFVMNVVLALAAAAGTVAFVPHSRDPERPRLDPIGALFSLAGLVGLVYAIIEAPDRGWTSASTLVLFVGSLAVLAAFVIWELRRDEPMLDPRLFKLPGFGTGSLSLTVQFFAAFGFFFIVLQYLQFVIGFSALKAAAVMLPMPLVMIPTARSAPAIAARFGFNRVGAAGLTLIAAGLAIMSLMGTEFSYPHFIAGLAVYAAGMGLAGTPATTAIISSLPQSKQGVASAVNDTTRELGIALGIAVLGSMLNDRYRSGVAAITERLPADVADRVRESIAFAQQGTTERLGPEGAEIVSQAEQAFVDGTGTALLTGSLVLLIAAVFVLIRAPRREIRADGQSANTVQSHTGA